MAADSPNRKWFTYVDNHGTHWNKMGQIDPGCNAIDGNTAATAGLQNFPAQSRRYSARKAVFLDPAKFRTKTCVIYTQAAEAAITGSSTVSVPIPGTATNATYTFDHLVPEKAPIKSVSRNLAD